MGRGGGEGGGGSCFSDLRLGASFLSEGVPHRGISFDGVAFFKIT